MSDLFIDIIRIVEGYLDIIVFRYFESGVVKKVVNIVNIFIINVGDGFG